MKNAKNNINIIGGAFCILISLTVIYGWFVGNTTLIQIYKNFSPMQFNTALGFLFLGFGLVFCSFEKRFLTQLAGVFVAMLGGLTLLQYLFGLELGLDNLFIDGSSVTTNVTHIGRMAPNTAICFLMSGLGLAFYRFNSISFSMIFSVLILSLFSVFAYAILNPESQSYLSLTRMAVHTTVCFLVFSISAIVLLRLGKEVSLWKLSPYISFLALFFMSIYVWHTENEYIQERYEEEFATVINEKKITIRTKLSNYIQALYGGRGLFNASEYVSREEWLKFVNAHDLKNNLKGTNGLGFIEYVKQENLDAYIENLKKTDLASFEAHPKTEFADKFIIKYIEPMEPNLKAVGLDIGFEENRREAAEKARDTGEVALTDIIYLVQDNKKVSGFLLLSPVYMGGEVPKTLEGRREDILGWVYSPFTGPNFFSDILEVGGNKLKFEVYSGDKLIKENLIYENSSSTLSEEYLLKIVTKIHFAGRVWSIIWYPSKDYKSSIKENPFLILIWGIIITLMFSILLYLLSRSFVLAKDEIRESKNFLELILKNNPDLIFVKDENFRVVQANDSFLSLYPKDIRDKVIGYTTLESYGDEEREGFLKNDKLAFLEGKSEAHETIIFPNGKKRSLFTQKIRFENTSGEKFILGIGRDVTDREALIEKLTDSNEELQNFAYICSHDLQEPLRMIRIFSEKIEKHFADIIAGDEKGKKYLSFIAESSERAQDLISDILSYSSIDLQSKALEYIELKDIMDAVKNNLSHVIKENNGKLSYAEMPVIRGNKTQIYQLFQNLINNSFKYISPDRAPVVEVSFEDKGVFWQFCIKDNGIGIKEKHYNKVFEVFKRLHVKHEYHGTGIGLSICKKIVQKHGGEIWIDSELGEGASFYFTIQK